MRTRLPSVVVGLLALLLASPAQAFKVILEGEARERCLEWARTYEATALRRTEGLTISGAEAASWAAAQRDKAARLCHEIEVYRSGGCGKNRTLVGSDFDLPSGFLEGVGINEADLRAWGTAEASQASYVYPHSSVRERLMRKPDSDCSIEPDGIGSEGAWIWCRARDTDEPNALLMRHLIRGGAIGGSVLGILGLATLLLVGRRATQTKQ